MNLPSDLFQATVTALRSSEESSHAHNGRGEPRRRLMGVATIIPCAARSGRVPMLVGVCDLSPSGIGIVHKAPLRAGEEFILPLPGSRGNPRRSALFTVVHWRPLSDGSFQMGACFTRELRTSAPDECRPGAGNEAGKSARPHAAAAGERTCLPVEQMAVEFREHVASGLTDDELVQLRQLEERLAVAIQN